MKPPLRNRISFFLALVSAAIILLVVVRFFVPSLLPSLRPQSTTSTVDQGLQEFFASHWQRPIPSQGSPPTQFSALEASLRPEACGTCHEQQYSDWKESLHSRAMGPGPWGQIMDMISSSPDDAVQCMTCHAPLSEQLPVLPKAAADNHTTYEANPHLDKELQSKGITCAACHVRQHQRFGPPKAEGAFATSYPADMKNHNGAKRTPHFEKAEFCKDCHQFDPENSLLVNGKPLQDPYREWQNSMWARDGVACQDCHMSNRRHLWKGIHDKEWVKGGIKFNVKPGPEARSSRTASVIVEVINSAVGHKFPTYTTPKVFVHAVLLDSENKSVRGTEKQYTIGWDVRFEGGEWKEFFDTRISPGESLKHRFQWPLSRQAESVRVWLEVHPDHFYHVHFYPAHLQRTDLSPEGRKLVGQALAESGKTPYTLYDQLLPLKTTIAKANSR